MLSLYQTRHSTTEAIITLKQSTGARHGPVVKAGVPHRNACFPAPDPDTSLLPGHPGKQQVMAQVAECLPGTWETWTESPAPGSGPVVGI